MAILSRSWDYINCKRGRQTAWSVLCGELARLLCLAPLTQCDLRTQFSQVVTCSDAWEKGGAVALATGLTQSEAELTQRLSHECYDPRHQSAGD